MKSRVIQVASVASMIDLFNRDNINILEKLGAKIDVASNFHSGSITSKKRVEEFKEELSSKNIDVIDIPCPRSIFKFVKIFRSYKVIKELANERNYQIVHCHSPIGGVITRLAFRKARKKGTKVIYTAHGFHFFNGASIVNWLLFYPIERFCSRITDILITINHEDYLRAKKWKTCKIECIPGIGIHTQEFHNIHIDKAKLRKEFSFELDDFVFMSTGQISVRKNHEVIIRALSTIENPKVKYLIVGFGEEEKKLQSLVRELSLEQRVVFTGYRCDVKNLLHMVDAFAFPSRQEGLPVALMEAMSVGLPVVCSRIRGNIDLIEDGKGGYLYDFDDFHGFAVGMKKIIADNNTNMGKTNIETMEKYDSMNVNALMQDLYEHLLKE